MAENGLALAALELYKDKSVEVNMGESAITMLYDDHTLSQKSVIRGILRDAQGEALIIECDVRGTKKKVIINCFMVLTITSFDAKGSTKNVYYDEGSSRVGKNRV